MAFECRPNCGECCYPTMMRRDRWERNQERVQRQPYQVLELLNDIVLPLTEDLRCVFLCEDNRCAIHDDKPDACTLFGTVADNPCPYIRIDGTPRTPRGVRRHLQVNDFSMDSSCRVKTSYDVAGTGHRIEIVQRVNFIRENPK